MTDIAVERVTKRFSQGVVAVDDVSLSIEQGEFMVLVGPSGCGKSTLLRMIAGLETVTEGRISIGGRDVTNLAPPQRDIAMIFQSYALYPHMSVERNLGYGLRVRKTPRAEIKARVSQVAEMLGLTDLLARRPAHLSGGQRQRVAMGRAIVREPAVYLMDEPLSNLDAKLRVGMRSELGRLHKRLGTTTVYVTHDQIEAMTLGTRITVMHDGAIQQVGTPQELYRQPANVFVAGFIGSPSMNLAPGRIADGRLAFGGISVPLSSLETVPAAEEITVGARPQAFRLGIAGAPESFEVPVAVVEDLGAETHVLFWLGPTLQESRGAAEEVSEDHLLRDDGRLLFTAALDGTPEVGERIWLTLDPGQLHFFDANSGERLRAASNVTAASA